MVGENNRVCPVSRASGLDSVFRKLLQNPHRILKKYIKDGMTVLDFGCGPGFFSIEIAKMVGENGKVIAVDLQKAMLEKLGKKIKGTRLESRIKLCKCSEKCLGLKEKVDFVLAFYVLHELFSQEKFLKEIKCLMKKDSKLLIVEPKFRVSFSEFEKTLGIVYSLGFKVIERPRIFLSRAVLVGF